MKLISITDFVLKECGKCGNEPRLSRIEKYAKFLKQPLTLGMFVPCGENGNVLEKPKGFSNIDMNIGEHSKLIEYEEAKEKVLFERFEIIQGEGPACLTKFLVYNSEDIGFKKEWKGDWEFEFNSIERLCELDLELTESAKKQIGI